jgi:hypothetical protein
MNDSLPPRPSEYIYLASPYSRADGMLREERYLAAAECVIWLLRAKRWVYSPIVHCHEISKIAELPKGFDYWQEYNFAMLLYARAFYILTIPGWRESDGVAGELAFSLREGILVRYVSKTPDGYEIKSMP